MSLAQQSPIRIGLPAPLRGIGGPYGQEKEQAARTAVKIINDAGGIVDRPREWTVAGDETQPTAGIAADKVASIADVWSGVVTSI